MRSTCGLCSSQGFFYVAAVTGCIFVILNMSFTEPPPLDSGVDLTASRASKFGPTYVVEPKGKHQATIVWLHGLGDDGSSWLQHLEPLPLPNIKWIFPTSPARPFTLFGGLPTTTWFDVVEMSEDATQDVEGMDASAAYVLSLLSIEPQEIKLGVGGFSMGAATAIYSASCFVRGKLENHTGSPTHLDAVVGLSGWLPCANDLSNEVEGNEVEGRAALPILLCHGRGDDVVNFRYGERSAEKLTLAGFEDLTFKSFNSLGHNVIPEEMNEVSIWLTSKLELEG
uniref:acyl-protein thioesterase 2-like n=1 Tax=Erigeron canadensis TaxID=72917 RepID=UPI001CB8B662|nr:acyl-protein thioesterase 2-like [Erigeron canadensis]